MIERLYQPDYSCIFGKKYANAFQYGNIDSLVWPIFIDVERSKPLEKLLDMKNTLNRKYFYSRNLSIKDLKVELECSNIDIVLFQAMDLGRDYGILNTDVINAVKKDPKRFKGILSYNLDKGLKSQDLIKDIQEKKSHNEIVGIALYPNFAKIDLINNQILKDLFKYCEKNNLFIKLDLGNHFLPDYYPRFTNYDIVASIASKYPNNLIILSNLDVSRDFILYYPLSKYYKNIWFEITPLSFGGLTPKNSFKEIFSINGFIQNCWNRLTVGSATPTLEMSQVRRGFIESLDTLTFAQKCILKTWLFRNINRTNQEIFRPITNKKSDGNNTFVKLQNESMIENDCEVNCVYKVTFRSYSITQLIFITDLVEEITEKTLNKFPDLNQGEIFVRSYHTTTSLIINEHEFGNYLDLHFKFAEISQNDSQNAFHTVSALENRADFNRFDHDLANTYGSRQLVIPIVNSKLEIGGRENFYILVTFGPRVFNLFFKVKLIKKK
jgi:thiamine phosphate synthase YjbQ (UPF0047 family)